VKNFCLLLLVLAPLCFAQNNAADAGKNDSVLGLAERLDYFPRFNLFHPVPLADGSSQNVQNQSIFANAPQWVKDLRRGEIVFFGSIPFTVFFARTFYDVYRMSRNNWDQRYAPWPFKTAGAVSMTSNELMVMFTIAGSVSFTIALLDHFVVKHKRKAAALEEY